MLETPKMCTTEGSPGTRRVFTTHIRMCCKSELNGQNIQMLKKSLKAAIRDFCWLKTVIEESAI